jgi:hypothetical protein
MKLNMRKPIITLLATIGLASAAIWYVADLTRFQTLAVVQETADSASYTIVRDRILHVTYKISSSGGASKIRALSD